MFHFPHGMALSKSQMFVAERGTVSPLRELEQKTPLIKAPGGSRGEGAPSGKVLNTGSEQSVQVSLIKKSQQRNLNSICPNKEASKWRFLS